MSLPLAVTVGGVFRPEGGYVRWTCEPANSLGRFDTIRITDKSH